MPNIFQDKYIINPVRENLGSPKTNKQKKALSYIDSI
jgi:hypothetical protein